MADEKVNMGPEENKPPETQSPPGQGDLPPLEENNAPAVSGEDKAAPDHVEPDPPSADKHTQRTVLPGMGEDTPAPSGKVINLSDIQAADKGGKEAPAPAPEKKAPEAEQPKKRRGRPPKEQAGVPAGKKEKVAEPRAGRPSKVDKAAREEAPPSVLDKVSRGKKADKGKETGSGGAPASKSAKAVKDVYKRQGQNMADIRFGQIQTVHCKNWNAIFFLHLFCQFSRLGGVWMCAVKQYCKWFFQLLKFPDYPFFCFLILFPWDAVSYTHLRSGFFLPKSARSKFSFPALPVSGWHRAD